MSSDSGLMNELLERIGSDERAVPAEPIGPAIYTLFDNLLTRIETLERRADALDDDAMEHLRERH